MKSASSKPPQVALRMASRLMLASALTLVMSGQHNVQAAPVGGIKIADLVETGINGIPGCINYCITGICVHLQYSLFTVTVIISPRIAHNTAEFTVSSFRAQGQQPWIEWRRVFGRVQAGLADGIFGLLSGTGRLGGYGTYTEEHQENDRQAPFKEVDINGHPLAMLPDLLNQGGGAGGGGTPEGPPEGAQPTEEQQYSEAETEAGSMVDVSDFGAMFMNPEILDVFSYVDTFNQMGNMAGEVTEVMDYFSQISDMTSAMENSDAVGGSGGVEFRIEDLLCESTVTPFMPYYLSAIDTLSWRVPWADVFTHFLDIGAGMVPFMSNRPVIGTSDGLPGLGGGTWGGLYPRMGFVRNEHDGKVGAVVSQRALDLILAENGNDQFGHFSISSPGFPRTPEYHVIPYRFRSEGVEGGVWQKVYPKPSYQCSPSVYQDKTVGDIAIDDSAPRSLSQNQNYIWVFWRRYQCCMQHRGIFAAAAPIPPICIIGDNVDDPDTGFEGPSL
ncbi:MAG: TraU family protein [Steroidobacteraceae bacterium]